MTKTTIEEIHSNKFTVADAADIFIEAIGPDKKLDAALIVIRAEGRQVAFPMGDPLKLYALLTSGVIEKGVSEMKKVVGDELSKRFDQFLSEMADKRDNNEGGGVA